MTVGIWKLLSRGDELSIERGRLVIHPASGKPIPQKWFREHSQDLIREILTTLGIEAYEYCNYTTGHYGPRKLPGITLQLLSVVARDSVYAIFNADLCRERNTKAGAKGSPLPKGHFRVGKCSHLYRLWLSTGLPEPKRLAALHDYMGNLAGILFLADGVEGHKNRMNAGSLHPLSIPVLEVRKAFLPDNPRTTSGHAPDNFRTKPPDKEPTQGPMRWGFQPKPTTCRENYGEAVIGEHEYTGAGLSPPQRKIPQEQSYEEWLEDYSRPGP